MKISCAIAGTGFWGQVFLKKLKNLSDFELKGVVSKSGRALEEFPVFKNCDELLRKHDVEIIFVLNDLGQHVRTATACLENRKNIFLTKPITTSVAEAVKLKKLAEKNSAKIFVDHTFLFNPNFKNFEGMTKGQKIKSFTSIRAQYGRFQKGSDVLGELLYHDLYMIRALMGRAKSVKSIGDHSLSKEIDQCFVELEFTGGARAKVFGSMSVAEKKKMMSAVTRDKILSWEDMAPSVYKESDYKFGYGQSGTVSAARELKFSNPRDGRDAIDHMLEHIASCLRGSKKSRIIDIDHGIEIMKIIDAARKSLAKNLQVQL